MKTYAANNKEKMREAARLCMRRKREKARWIAVEKLKTAYYIEKGIIPKEQAANINYDTLWNNFKDSLNPPKRGRPKKKTP